MQPAYQRREPVSDEPQKKAPASIMALGPNAGCWRRFWDLAGRLHKGAYKEGGENHICRPGDSCRTCPDPRMLWLRMGKGSTPPGHVVEPVDKELRYRCGNFRWARPGPGRRELGDQDVEIYYHQIQIWGSVTCQPVHAVLLFFRGCFCHVGTANLRIMLLICSRYPNS